MKTFLEATREALIQKNWYAALTLALTLPDICGYLQSPDKKSGVRYAEWFTRYLGFRYSMPGHQFLTGNDCYALRCAFLHQGEVNISSQRVRERLSSFLFIVPPPSGSVHNNQVNDILQLQVDEFVKDICQGVDLWLLDVRGNEDIQMRMRLHGRIYDVKHYGRLP